MDSGKALNFKDFVIEAKKMYVVFLPMGVIDTLHIVLGSDSCH